MAASADLLMTGGPRRTELWLDVALSILVHALLVTLVFLTPRFQIGTYITIPVSYQVDLISATPGSKSGGASAPAPAAASPPAPVARPAAPPPRAVSRPSEELTLPGKQPLRKAPAAVEPSLRPPSVTGRETLRPTPSDLRPQTPSAAIAPASPSPLPATASTAPPGKGSGIELAGGEKGEGSGGSALGYYLGLVDYKISTNWVPPGTGSGRDNVVVIRFRVFPSGTVRDVELETSSGDAGLDTSAMRAIRQSLPLPPFPNLLTEKSLDLRYRFVMERG